MMDGENLIWQLGIGRVGDVGNMYGGWHQPTRPASKMRIDSALVMELVADVEHWKSMFNILALGIKVTAEKQKEQTDWQAAYWELHGSSCPPTCRGHASV